MKSAFYPVLLFVCLLPFFKCNAQPADAPLSAEAKPAPILAAMEKVSDWQLANPSKVDSLDWINGAGDAGLMALVGISGNPRYREAMLELGKSNSWKLGPLTYDADHHCVGQTWAELYMIYRDPAMIQPMRERFDFILANPTQVTNLEFIKKQAKQARQNWSWCDSLFMAPPAWVRLSAVTGDERYTDFAVSNWWKTTDYLYDKEEHLYFRDSNYFNQKEANGKKVFWGRGNGWVMGGLVRVLQYLPSNHPQREKFEKLFKDMAEKISSCQQPDGMWRASLLDPDSYPLKETSSSGFYTYALAWGVNQGLLDKAHYQPAVVQAWRALVGCVNADGKLTHVQPVGADPKKFSEDSTEPYGVGAFLLAGSELYRMVVLESAKAVKAKVHNPANFWRESETVEVELPGKVSVMDGLSSRIVDSQQYSESEGAPQKLVFQVDLAPGESRDFIILNSDALAATPKPLVKTFARYVPERFDDFAWESDRTAHRAYGQALIKAEGTVTSGPDVWIKRDRRLIVDVMYATKHYHEDNGEFMDDFRVGKSRGCGGVGIWDGKTLHNSSNYKTWKLITTGPVRSVFELAYEPWDAGNGRMVSEIKRYGIDAGSWFTFAQSRFSSDDKSPLTIGVGLAERSAGPGGTEEIAQDIAQGWMTYWQPEDKPKGTIGTAVVLPKGSVSEFTTDMQDMPDAKLHEPVPQPTHEGASAIRNLLAITKAEVDKPFAYYFGACWDRSGDFTNRVQWEAYVKQFAARRDHPLEVAIGK